MNYLPELLANKDVLESLDWSELSLFWTTGGGQEDDNRDDDNVGVVVVVFDDENTTTADENDHFCDFVVTVGRSRRTRQTFRKEQMRRNEMAAVLETLLKTISSISCSNNNNNVVQQLYASTDGTVVLPVDCVTRMIHHLKQLQGLHVGRGLSLTSTTCCTKSNSNTDLMLLVQALSHHPTLRTVSLHNVQMNVENDSSSAYREQDSATLSFSRQSDPSGALLDPLIEAIASIPNLECVDLSLQQEDVDDNEEDQEQRQPDEELDHLDDFAFAAFTGRRRHRRRRSIRKSLALVDSARTNMLSPCALRSLLQIPPHLEQVSLWNWSLTDQHILQGLVPALLQPSARSGVRFLSLRQNPAITTAGWKALYQVVEDGHNYSLQHIMSDYLDENEDEDTNNTSPSSSSQQQQRDQPSSCHARGKFFLELNQQDRGELLSQTSCCSKTKWCQVLEQFSHDPAALYYWVQQASPSVF